MPADMELAEHAGNGPEAATPRGARELEAVYDIPVTVSAVLGKSTMQVSQLLKLGRGAVVELDRKLGEAIDIYVNNRLVVTMTEIVKADRSLRRSEACKEGRASGGQRPGGLWKPIRACGWITIR